MSSGDNKIKGLVSVIIPTYNRPDFLKQAVDSVLRQSYGLFEILVIDDCSPYSTKQFLAENFNDSRIQVYINEKNSGPSHSMNRGIDNSKGEFIAFLDDDDYWLNNHLAFCVQELQKNNSARLCYSGVSRFWHESKEVVREVIPDKQKNTIALLEENFITNSSVVLKSEFVGKLRFNEEEKLLFNKDWIFWVEYLSFHPLCSTNTITVKYGLHTKGNMMGQNLDTLDKHRLIALKDLEIYFKGNKTYKKYRHKIVEGAYLTMIRAALNQKSKLRALRYFKKIISESPRVFFNRMFYYSVLRMIKTLFV